MQRDSLTRLPEPRLLIVFLLETSGLMKGEKVTALNDAMLSFRAELMAEDRTGKRVEIAVVTFDSSIRVRCEFETPAKFWMHGLSARGQAAMGAGIVKTLDLVEARLQTYRANELQYYRPWIIMVAYGVPTDSLDVAMQRLSELVKKKKVLFSVVGVEGANMEMLEQILVDCKPAVLTGLKLAQLFSRDSSPGSESRSKVGEQVDLPPKDDWGSV